VETRALANRVHFDKDKAIGVEYRTGNSTKHARASREVIICGGVFNSPQLLMLSGIGDENELKALRIPVVDNLPGVGKNLQDHVQVYVQFVSTFKSHLSHLASGLILSSLIVLVTDLEWHVTTFFYVHLKPNRAALR